MSPSKYRGAASENLERLGKAEPYRTEVGAARAESGMDICIKGKANDLSTVNRFRSANC